MKAILILVILLLPLPAMAFDPWTKTDYALETTYILLETIDWLQTRETAKHPEKYSENNACLGKHPTLRKVDLWFPLTTLAQVGIAAISSHPYRTWWQVSGIALELGCVVNNHHVGIRINHPFSPNN